MSTAEAALYPPLEPYAIEKLRVGAGHTLHMEQCGNPEGFPAIFLHGGPGSQTRPAHRRFFDPRFYRIVLFDQRGCGRSEPAGRTEYNTTRHLVDDIETLCEHLGLGCVLLFGGSWGATLALAFAGAHPERIAAMVLRGVFLGSREEVNAYLGLGARVPQAWQALAQGAGSDLLARYHMLVDGRDTAAAQRWVAYEDALMRLDSAESPPDTTQAPESVLARARIQLHYLAHDCFLERGALLAGLARLSATPTVIVQGRSDLICPPGAALEVAKRLPGAELRLVEGAGHSAAAPEMAHALRRATDDLRTRLARPGMR